MDPEPAQDNIAGNLPTRAMGPSQTSGYVGLVLKERYRIVEELGKGGFGSVYLAEDEELCSKRVVVKVLHGISADEWRLRKFQQEKEALARIDHPGVVAVFDSGQMPGGTPFLVMQFVDGVTLRKLIRPGGMDFPRAAEIFQQIGSALQAAHDSGICHRDLKPENIMVQELSGETRVRLIDFGIAAVNDSAYAGASTRIAGTIQYMAPEQLEGKFSPETDVYAFGAIAFEVLTSKPAVPSMRQAMAIGAEELKATPREVRPDIPEPAESIIVKALSLEAEGRFHSAREMGDLLAQALRGRQTAEEQPGVPRPESENPPADELQLAHFPSKWPRRAIRPAPRWLIATGAVVLLGSALGGYQYLGRSHRNAAGVLWPWQNRKRARSGPDNPPSIAVLPFADMSPGKDQEYVGDGLAAELLDALAKTPGLRVAGRTSTFQFKGKNEDVGVIAKKLNVSAILEGSVRKQGNRARISAQLINAADGYQVWSETFEREMNDIFAVQEEIAGAVTGALKIKLLGGKTAEPSPEGPKPQAYNSYLMGRYFLYAARNKENLEKAESYFERAIQVDPDYAPAWAALGKSLSNLASWGYIPDGEGYRKAREAIERALTLDSGLGEAYAVLGDIQQSRDWDWAGADASFQRALGLEPGDALVIGGAGGLAWIRGRFDEAITLYRRAIDIDPLYPNLYVDLGLVLNSTGQYEEAKIALNKALELAPDMQAVHAVLSRVDLLQSDPQSALAEAQKEKHPILGLCSLALAYHALGQKKEADAQLAEMIGKFQADAPYQIAAVYAFRGQTDEAFRWLARAYTERDAGLSEIKGDPLMNALKHDSRYVDLLKKMHLL